MSLQLTEQILSTINTGKTASLVYSHVLPTLIKLREAAIIDLMGDFRAGKFDGAKAQAKIAQLCVIADIESALKQQINKGETALTRTQGDM